MILKFESFNSNAAKVSRLLRIYSDKLMLDKDEKQNYSWMAPDGMILRTEFLTKVLV